MGVIFVVVFCQFITAFSALGIPPFFSLILERSFSSTLSASYTSFAGILFVVPTFFSAVTSPFWGHFADRYGKKALLLRSQLGLSLSFLAAGYSTTPIQFFLSLLAQGILGGTFAASRAYLATLLEGEQLAHGLTLMEAAPRAALVTSPLVMGILIHSHNPITIYRYLALLPALTAGLTVRLPESRAQKKTNYRSISSASQEITSSPLSSRLILILQFLFGVASILASPYFSHAVKNRFTSLSTGQIGLLFGLPHLVYLACAAPLSVKISSHKTVETLIGAFILQSIALIGQGQAHTLLLLILWRLVMGVSMTASFVCIHNLISNVTHPSNAGGLFGWLEGCVKMSTVVGGVIASAGFGYFGSQSLFFISAASFLSTSIFLTCRTWFISRERPV